MKGVVLKYINTVEPISGRACLLVAFGSMDDDVSGIDATLDVAINGKSVEEIVAEIARPGISATNKPPPAAAESE